MVKLPSAEEIWRLYDQEKLSAGAIADKLGVSQMGVIHKLKRAGYKLRSLSEAHKLAYRVGRHKPTSATGPDHWAWKGGKERRAYRGKVKKEKCESCGGKLNLCVHHKNLDHYDNNPENLQVLCVSCHISLHKKMYWNAVKAGKEPLRSNGPIGWGR